MKSTQETEKSSIISTFAFDDTIAVKNTTVEKWALTFREIFHNAYAYGATKMEAFFYNYGNSYYVALASDATPFDSADHLMSCLHPNTSGGEKGVQGSGMKRSIFNMVKDNRSNDDAQLVVLSRMGSNGFSLATLDVVNGTKVQIKEDIKMKSDLIKSIGTKSLGNVNVVVLYRVGKTPPKESLEVIMDAFVNITDKKAVQFAFVGAQNAIASSKNSLSNIKRTGNTTYRFRSDIYSKEDKQNEYCVYAKEIKLRDVPIKDSQFSIDATLNFSIFPNILSNGKTYNFKKKQFPNDVRLANNTFTISIGEKCFKLDPENGRHDSLKRVLNDAIYSRTEGKSGIFMSSINCSYTAGINYNKNNQLESYKHKPCMEGLKNDVRDLLWKPFVTTEIRIDKINAKGDLKSQKTIDIDDINCFFPLSPFFTLSSNSEISKNIIDAVAEYTLIQCRYEIDELSKEMDKHFPTQEEERLPLDIRMEAIKDKIYAKNADTGDKIKILELDKPLLAELYLSYDDTPVTSEVEVIYRNGVTNKLFSCLHIEDNLYKLNLMSEDCPREVYAKVKVDRSEIKKLKFDFKCGPKKRVNESASRKKKSDKGSLRRDGDGRASYADYNKSKMIVRVVEEKVTFNTSHHTMGRISKMNGNGREIESAWKKLTNQIVDYAVPLNNLLKNSSINANDNLEDYGEKDDHATEQVLNASLWQYVQALPSYLFLKEALEKYESINDEKASETKSGKEVEIEFEEIEDFALEYC